MKIFIDSGDLNEIREAAAMGLVDGVTTNPSLVAKSGRKFRDVLLEICEPARPVVVRSADQGTFTTLVMPVRLDG